MAQVHAKAFDVAKEDVDYMEVEWSENGEAVFHDICWKVGHNVT